MSINPAQSTRIRLEMGVGVLLARHRRLENKRHIGDSQVVVVCITTGTMGKMSRVRPKADIILAFCQIRL